MSYRITFFTHIKCLGLALGIAFGLYGFVCPVLQLAFLSVLKLFPALAYSPAPFYFAICYGVLFIIMTPVTILHEMLHGLVFMLLGGEVRYGFKVIYAYTQETSGLMIERLGFMAVLLSPLAAISLLSAVIGGWFGGLIFVLNLLGSSGDLLMAAGLLRYGDGCRFVDRSYGYDVVMG